MLQDIRFGVRVLRKNPGFTLVATLTLALGIGANTAIFSLINAVILNSLPVRRPAELVVVGDPARAHEVNAGTPQSDLFSYPLYRELRDHNNVFSGMMASGIVSRGKVETEGTGLVTNDATGTLVSGNYFSVLGVGALLGRTLTTEDDGAPGGGAVVVVSYDFWRQKLSEAPDIVGKQLRINDFPYTVIGVAAPGFFGDTVGSNQDFWVPLAMQAWLERGRPRLEDIQISWLRSMARLKPGVSVGQAQADMNVIFQQWVKGPRVLALDASDQDTLRKAKVPVVPGGRGFSDFREDAFVPLMVLMGIVGLVLLIACANVANLLLARATARQREIALRLAIGATRIRLVRQLLTESLILAFAGGCAGLLLAAWGSGALLRLSMGRASAGLTVKPDLRLFAFTAGVCLLTGLLFGLAPALRVSQISPGATLKEGTLGWGRLSGFPLGKVLVSLQVSVCLLVLFAAGLLLRSLNNLKNVDLGYDKNHILMVRADPVPAGYKPAQIITFEQEMVTRLRSVPGIASVAASENGLFSGTESASMLKIEGYTAAKDQDRLVFWDQIGADYFKSLNVPVLLGREFGLQDTPTSPRVAIINQSMSRFFFGEANPIGRKLWIDDQEHREKPFEIIGVVRDVRDHAIRGPIQRRFYICATQPEDTLYAVNFEINTAGNPEAVTEAVRKVFAGYDPKVVLTRVRTAEMLVDASLSQDFLIARLSMFFGLVALLLASVGLYGLMSYTVGRRTREIGLRMALGAQRLEVLKMIVMEASKLVLIGLLVGIPASLAASRLLSSVLFGLKFVDPLSLGAVVLLLVVVALFAAVIPAHRASKVDPMVALRYE
jgi:putative ABC transport system permease protein